VSIRIEKPGQGRRGSSRPTRRLTPAEKQHRKRSFEIFKYAKADLTEKPADKAEMQRLADEAVGEGRVTKLKDGYASNASGMSWEQLWLGRTPK